MDEERFNYEVDDATRFVDNLKDRVHELYDENKRLKNIINKTTQYVQSLSSKGRGCDIYEDIKQEILKELKGSNEPSFEEMVGFVENVCKDIKNQSTLPEELEEERKTIAKIVGDFKEVIKSDR